MDYVDNRQIRHAFDQYGIEIGELYVAFTST